jgi:DNA-binding SARP family transcriptional activator/tetratricopeptide (TPR) repeat protein
MDDRNLHVDLVVRLLGDADVRVGGDLVKAFGSPKLQSLLAFLVLRRDSPQLRQKVAFLFWPDSTEGQARTNLRQALHNLRHALRDPNRYLRMDNHTVQWLADGPSEVDVVRFETDARAGLADGDQDALDRAAEVYRGDLLEGCYDDWIIPERDRLKGMAASVLGKLVDVACQRADPVRAVQLGERLLQLDPLDEPNYRILMRVHAAAGDRARAVRTYHSCVSVLKRELGVGPDAETLELYAEIVAHSGDHDGGGLLPPGPAAMNAPLIGRDHEFDQLVAAWRETANGQPRFVLVSGEPGIGKSRLVEDFRSWCGRQAVATIIARAYEAEGTVPYGPIVDVLRSEVVRPTLNRLDPVWLGELSRVLPELPAVEVRSADVSDAGTARHRLFEAIARALVVPDRSLVWTVDDLHWCDAETLDLLDFTARFAAKTSNPLLIVGTARQEELASQPRLRALVARLHAVAAVVELKLPRLKQPDAAALAQELLGPDAQEATIERLVNGSEGNPLFLVEMARSDMTAPDATAADKPLPPRVQSVIETRLEQLSTAARELAVAAAVVGRPFTIDIVSRLVSEDIDIVAEIDELWRRGIVRERGSDGYDFSHDKIREVAYRSLGPARRRRLHAAVARALEATTTGRVDDVAAQIAAHLDRAGQIDGALASYRRAVTVAAHAFAHYDVITYCRRALQLLIDRPAGPDRDDLELDFLVPLGVALMGGPGIFDADQAMFERARTLRAQRGLAPEPSTLRLSANAANSRRDFHEARGQGVTLLERGEREQNPVLITEGRYLLGVTSFWLGEIDASRHHLDAALASNRPEHTPLHLEHFGQDPRVVCLIRLALTLFHLGRDTDAAPLFEQGLATATAGGHPYTEVYARMFGAWYLTESGSPERAALLVNEVAPASATHTMVSIGRAMFGGWSDTARGDPQRAIPRLEDALRQIRDVGNMMLEPFTLLMLAQSRALIGDTAAALTAATSARAIATEEMPFHAPEACRLNGELLLRAGGETAEGIAMLREAVRTAALQGSVLYELRARVSLLRALRRHDRLGMAAEERALRAACNRLPPECGLAEVASASVELAGDH